MMKTVMSLTNWLRKCFQLQQQRIYAYIPSDVEHTVFDYSKGPFGLLVTRSDHWYAERRQHKPHEPDLGIVTDRSFFMDSRGRIICWPLVQWEGQCHTSMNHPLNVKPFRANHGLPTITMDEGQWGTYGPPTDTTE
jgi:hypothetical protein